MSIRRSFSLEFGPLLGLALAAVLALGGAAEAVPVDVSCPGTATTADREFIITTDPGTAICIGYAAGNLGGSDSDFPGWTFLDKNPGTGGALDDALTISGISATSGSFSFSAPGYTDFIIVFKSGEGQLDPDWAAFSLPFGVTSGQWLIDNSSPDSKGDQSLSHANLYGKECILGGPCGGGANEPGTVPLPAGLPLLLSAIGFGGLFQWARRRKSATA